MAIPSGVIRWVRSVSTVLLDLDNSFVASVSHCSTLIGFLYGGYDADGSSASGVAAAVDDDWCRCRMDSRDGNAPLDRLFFA
mmetsp:Transcript_3367/g.5038  ORF Transcript_3367/g.5038 Transcript_3367/m.5038 type:complete len:82 (-) Transcript_3367:208-453(-)